MSSLTVLLRIAFFGLVVCASACSDIQSRVLEEKKAAEALQILRDIRSAETAFKNRLGRYGTLSELIKAQLVTADLEGGLHADYRFSVVAASNTYEVTAIPANEREAYRVWSFYLDESGVLRGAAYRRQDNEYRAAGKADQPLMRERQ